MRCAAKFFKKRKAYHQYCGRKFWRGGGCRNKSLRISALILDVYINPVFDKYSNENFAISFGLARTQVQLRLLYQIVFFPDNEDPSPRNGPLSFSVGGS